MEKKTPQRKGKIKSTKKDQRRKKFSHTSNWMLIITESKNEEFDPMGI
jgi:hypothetical protein